MQTLFRILLVALVVLLIPVLLIGVPPRAADGGFEVIVRVIALAAGVVALAAIALALQAMLRVRRLEADLTRYARSVETLLRRAGQQGRDPTVRQGAVEPAATQRPPVSQPDPAVDLSIQPVIDIEADATTGHLVYAVLLDMDGRDRHVAFPAGKQGEGFALAALKAATHLPDAAGEAIIVPLADATLDDADAVDLLEAAFPNRAAPPILSLRTGHAPETQVARQAAERLARAGYGFAVDFAEALDLGGPALERLGVAIVRARAPALIASLGADRTIQAAIAALPPTVRLVAVDVAAETDALALAGRGVRYMAGPLFGDPKRLARAE